MKKCLLAVASVVLVACATTPNISESDYIGLTVEQAEQKAEQENTRFRVIMRDGESLPATMDFVPGRINAEVNNDIVTDYTVEGEATDPSITYDENSWRTMIDDSCMSFFDGCNTCYRNPDDGQVACTEMFCEEYQKPACLDE